MAQGYKSLPDYLDGPLIGVVHLGAAFEESQGPENGEQGGERRPEKLPSRLGRIGFVELCRGVGRGIAKPQERRGGAGRGTVAGRGVVSVGDLEVARTISGRTDRRIVLLSSGMRTGFGRRGNVIIKGGVARSDGRFRVKHGNFAAHGQLVNRFLGWVVAEAGDELL